MVVLGMILLTVNFKVCGSRALTLNMAFENVQAVQSSELQAVCALHTDFASYNLRRMRPRLQ